MRTQPTPGRLANISSSAITISIRIPLARASISITRRIRPFAAFIMSKDSGSLCPCFIISISTCARKLCNSSVSSRDRWRSWASGDAMPPPPPTPTAPPDAPRGAAFLTSQRQYHERHQQGHNSRENSACARSCRRSYSSPHAFFAPKPTSINLPRIYHQSCPVIHGKTRRLLTQAVSGSDGHAKQRRPKGTRLIGWKEEAVRLTFRSGCLEALMGS